MSRPFAVFDIDGTVFRSSLYLEIVTELSESGVLPPETLEEFQPAFTAWKERSHQTSYDDYRNAVVNAYEKRMEGLRGSDFDKAARNVVKKLKNHTYVYPRSLIRKLKNKGYFLIAISGSQLEMVNEFAKYWGFDSWVGQRHQRIDGVMTGNTQKTHEGKHVFLDKIIKDNQLGRENSFGVGDSIGDKELLEAVENPVAFNPDRELFEYAVDKHWKIVVERKNMIYELDETKGRYVLKNE